MATTSDDYIPQLKFYNLLLLLSNSVEGRNVITELFYTRHNVTITKKFTRTEIKQFAAEIKKKIVEYLPFEKLTEIIEEYPHYKLNLFQRILLEIKWLIKKLWKLSF